MGVKTATQGQKQYRDVMVVVEMKVWHLPGIVV